MKSRISLWAVAAALAAFLGCGSDSPDLAGTTWAEDRYQILESSCDDRFDALIGRFRESEADLLYRRTSTVGGGGRGNGAPPIEPGTLEPYPPEVDLGIDRPLEYYLLRRSSGIFRLEYNCDEMPDCTDDEAGAAEGKFPDGAFINVGTIAAPCLVDVSGKMRGRLDQSPTRVTYDLELDPREGCDFAACDALVETRRTKLEEREDSEECTHDVQCAGRQCVDCSALPADLSCSSEQERACLTATEPAETNPHQCFNCKLDDLGPPYEPVIQ